MSSDEQSRLSRFVEDPDEAVEGVESFLSGVYGRLRNSLSDIGLDLDWWGRSPWSLDTDEDIWTYQWVVAYSKGELVEGYDFNAAKGNRSARKGSPSPEVQFKVGIFVLGEPTDELARRLRDVDQPRLVTAFNTREYESYMDGFGFSEVSTYTERERVSAREVEEKHAELGVPWFEVEAYDENGALEGYADGYFNPFSTETTIEETVTGADYPEQEVWRIRRFEDQRSAGGQWEIGAEPDTRASSRLGQEAIHGKSVYIGPYEVGTITDRKTAWLRKEYKRGGKFTDKKTITEQSGIPPQALQTGVKLYKYKETEDAIYLSTTEPPTGFEPVDPDDVDPSQVGVETTSEQVTRVLLDEDDPTTFTVETDETEGRLLGLYDPVVVRQIGDGTTLVPHYGR